MFCLWRRAGEDGVGWERERGGGRAVPTRCPLGPRALKVPCSKCVAGKDASAIVALEEAKVHVCIYEVETAVERGLLAGVLANDAVKKEKLSNMIFDRA